MFFYHICFVASLAKDITLQSKVLVKTIIFHLAMIKIYVCALGVRVSTYRHKQTNKQQTNKETGSPQVRCYFLFALSPHMVLILIIEQGSF